MNKPLGEVTVNVKTNLTIDDDTAYTILGLLQMYCREKKYTIDISYTSPVDKEDFEITFDFKDDKRPVD